MAKTSTVKDNTKVSESLGNGGGMVVLIKHETDKADTWEFYTSLSEANAEKAKWDD
tara:strand:- start:295 stop:462 length:168 start_codon:yes stop_codon:yes gene_type:complete